MRLVAMAMQRGLYLNAQFDLRSFWIALLPKIAQSIKSLRWRLLLKLRDDEISLSHEKILLLSKN